MRIAPTAVVSLLLLVAPAPVHAGGSLCGWVDGVTEWKGSLSWSWQHRATWGIEGSDLTGRTADAGSGTFTLSGSGSGIFTGDFDGHLSLFDRLDVTDLTSGHTTYVQRVLSGSMLAGSLVSLYLEPTDCTYTFGDFVMGAGIQTSESGSFAIAALSPHSLLPRVDYEIPEVVSSLEDSDLFPVSTTGALPPSFNSASSEAAISAFSLGNAQLGSARVEWIFSPSDSQAPLWDACGGAKFVFGNTATDDSFATSSGSDPTQSCGGGTRSLWFLVLAEETGIAHVSTAGSGHPSTVAVYDYLDGCGNPVELGCGANDASFPVEQGRVYRLQVRRSANGTSGAVQVTFAPEPDALAAAGVALLALGARRRRVRPTRARTR